jgi:hypothetical protein
MTSLAGCAELPSMFVRMAGTALPAQAEIRPLEVFHPDGHPLRQLHARRIVASRAGQSGVPAIQRISGLAMIELVDTDVPANGNKLLAVMLRVALYALFFTSILSQ